jgi:starch-binding outer membrane protein, SusD/RagB family
MKLLKITFLIALFLGVGTSCQDQLDVKNPNEPTVDALSSEQGFLKFALAGVYINGFKDLKYQDGVVGLFWGNGYFDLMADNIGAEAANVFMNQIGCPESVKLDDGKVVANPNAPTHQPSMLRQNNLNANGGQNSLYYEWAYMYSLNKSCNLILSNADKVPFSGDVNTKKSVLKAWAYWWKGFAYSRIGSIYYAGLIVDNTDAVAKPELTNGNYKTNVEVLAEAESNFKKAEDILKVQTVNADYTSVLKKIIPDFNQTGKGGALSPAEWIRNINTMRARNLLANKRVAAMTLADWDNIITLTSNGIKNTDLVFTLRSNSNGDILSPQSGALSAKSTGDPASTATYKISERLIQAFQPNDKRKDNNFDFAKDGDGNNKPWIGNPDRGNAFHTRWQLLDGGNGISGVIVFSDRAAGAYELFMAGSYEENELMKAEANIYKGGANIDIGITLINTVRSAQGAGISSSLGLTQPQAITQLRNERRIALLFRSVAFYDARRYGVIDPISSGGGLTGAVVVDVDGNLNTNSTIDYQYLDYWDVPDNELVYNPPVAGSAAVKNPKQ